MLFQENRASLRLFSPDVGFSFDLCVALLVRTVILFYQRPALATSLNFNYLPNTLSPTKVTLKVKLQHKFGRYSADIKSCKRKLNFSVLSNESMPAVWLVGRFFFFTHFLPNNSLFVSFLRNTFPMIKVTRTQRWCLKLPTLNLLIDPAYLSAEQGGEVSVLLKMNSSELWKPSWCGKRFLSGVKLITELAYPA